MSKIGFGILAGCGTALALAVPCALGFLGGHIVSAVALGMVGVEAVGLGAMIYGVVKAKEAWKDQEMLNNVINWAEKNGDFLYDCG